jgi:inorganic triphosphatase YgiF
MRPLEQEGALVVRADRPTEVLDEIAALAGIGEWAFEPLPAQTIEDVYFDDDKRSLGSRRVALRVRRMDEAILLTRKSPGHRSGGVTTRVEIEAPWSPQALQRVVSELETIGDAAWAPSPEDAFGAVGLRPVQRRTTNRVRRAVLDDDGRTIAELALDSVSYDLTGGPARLCEAEVEARAEDAAVGPILDALAARFDALAPWPHSKVATGFAADRALRAGAIDGGELTPPALDVLDRALAGG